MGNPLLGHQHITSGPDGNLWFVDFNGDALGRITSLGAITEFSLPNVGSGPDGITSGADGSVWFAENDGNRIGRYSP